ncbi:vesicle-associated membrane protein 3-like isoform X2 [Tachypleus tridentatus]|uniref:vesicle-associated membrane protein 3-like isoform X2 n=1 Tax=Tachypleus tridentatus TaxID=6853 RepID=UPI003FD4F375
MYWFKKSLGFPHVKTKLSSNLKYTKVTALIFGLGATFLKSQETGREGGEVNPQHQAASKRVQQSQAQVDEVVDIMRTNVEKVLERDQKLSELDDRADALQQGASQFEQHAGKLKRKFWWKNLKMIAIMVIIGVIFVVIITVWAVYG